MWKNMKGRKALSHFRNQTLLLKRIYFDNQAFLRRLWSIAERGSSLISSQAILSKMKHIIGRKKSLTNSNLKKESYVYPQNNRESGLLNLKMLYFILNWQKLNHHFPVTKNILKFHLQETLYENFFLKHSKKLLSIAKKAISKEEMEKQWGGPEAYKLIVFIKDDFNEVVNKNPSVLVFFSADWCQHCQRLRSHFGTAALMAKDANLSVVFATFDVTSDPNIADENGVVGIPTLKYYNNGKIISTFRGKRTADDLFAYVKNPISTLKENKNADV